VTNYQKKALHLIESNRPWTAPELAFIAGWQQRPGAVDSMVAALEGLESRGLAQRDAQRMCMRTKKMLPTWRAVENRKGKK
jgi:hypothetical protein